MYEHKSILFNILNSMSITVTNGGQGGRITIRSSNLGAYPVGFDG
jgi:hypothetical protein